jgi:putative tryptophan/tyrosine transport system substrate-binding protein
LVAKRLGLLHELLPRAVRVAVLVNPADATNTASTLRDVEAAARAIGLQVQVLNASSSREINVAFEDVGRDRPDDGDERRVAVRLVDRGYFPSAA